MEYGIQLYSVRDLTEKNLDDALRQVSALGYRFVEFAGFFGHSAEDVRAMLEKYNLTVSGTHTGWQEIAERFEKTVAYHKAIGNREAGRVCRNGEYISAAACRRGDSAGIPQPFARV